MKEVSLARNSFVRNLGFSACQKTNSLKTGKAHLPRSMTTE